MLGWLKKKMGDGVTGGSTSNEIQQSLVATIIRACPSCGAPGIDSNGAEVGDSCPSCGARRPKHEYLGQIWKKERRSGN